MKVISPNLGDMELRLLRIFVAVVECGGLTKAQIELNLSLSSISSYVSQLEARLGVRLCHRGRGGFSLTEKGQIVYASCTELFRSHEDFRTRVGGLQGALVGELRFGVVENLVFDPTLDLPELIREFQQENDRVWMSLCSLPPSGLESALLEGRIHVGIGQYFRRLPSLSYETLYVDRQTLYCGRGHPLFERAPHTITLEELEQARFADRGYAEASRLPRKGLRFQPASTGHNVEAILMFVLSGHFISYLPDHYAQAWVQQGRLRALLPERVSLEIEIALAVQRSVKPTSLVRTFIEDVRKLTPPGY